MRRKNSVLYTFLAAGLLVAFSNTASAQFSITITVDENCNGHFSNTAGFNSALVCGARNDPGPGGLAGAATYDLLNPPGMVSGDLILLEPGTTVGLLSDIIRFNSTQIGPGGGTGTLVFYSDADEGGDSLADIGFPTALYTNNLSVFEVGAEGANNGVSYTPTSGQPGFISGAGGPVTYVISSDHIPEPSSILLMFAGVGLAWLSVRRRKARA